VSGWRVRFASATWVGGETRESVKVLAKIAWSARLYQACRNAALARSNSLLFFVAHGQSPCPRQAGFPFITQTENPSCKLVSKEICDALIGLPGASQDTPVIALISIPVDWPCTLSESNARQPWPWPGAFSWRRRLPSRTSPIQ